ncbi:unnamed protein product [Diatraea saccharalis]|uniref:FLYWCH-type domain-containing protein n=1 Tax=Diatraea saccharalis TaxID=40085 RepID=A0A9N9WDE5_9NEOP|nr:unnamed protein product [Diatraea saccharalis]
MKIIFKWQMYQCVLFFPDYVFIPGLKNELLMFGGYSFAQNHTKRLWYCSQKRLGCKAKVQMNSDNCIVFADSEHCHKPPEYHITKSGQYVLLRNSKKRKRSK